MLREDHGRVGPAARGEKRALRSDLQHEAGVRGPAGAPSRDAGVAAAQRRRQAPSVANPIRLSATPIRYEKSSPLLGEHNTPCCRSAWACRPNASPNCRPRAWSEPRPPFHPIQPMETDHMKTFITRRHLAALALAAAVAPAMAQKTPIKFVVPYPAGGAADQITRLVAARDLGDPGHADHHRQQGRCCRHDRGRHRGALRTGRQDLLRRLQRAAGDQPGAVRQDALRPREVVHPGCRHGQVAAAAGHPPEPGREGRRRAGCHGQEGPGQAHDGQRQQRQHHAPGRRIRCAT